MSDKIEQIVGSPPSFEQQIWEKHKSQCANCGGQHKLRVKMIVPAEAGGQEVVSNGVLICRACEMATDAAARPGSEGLRRPINFWVSRRLYNRMQNGMRTHHGFKSMGALIRYLMSMYVTDANRFDDLDRYQDAATGDVKINVWVPTDQYETFKHLVNVRGLTVTGAVKSLIQVYDSALSG